MHRTSAAPKLSVLIVAQSGKVAGVDPTDGALLWRNELPGGGYGPVELHVTDDAVLAVAGGKLYCLERSTGKTWWEVSVAGTGRGTMLVEGNLIFVSCSGSLTCVNSSGQQQWRSNLTGMGMGTAALGVPGQVRQGDDIGGQ